MTDDSYTIYVLLDIYTDVIIHIQTIYACEFFKCTQFIQKENGEVDFFYCRFRIYILFVID